MNLFRRMAALAIFGGSQVETSAERTMGEPDTRANLFNVDIERIRPDIMLDEVLVDERLRIYIRQTQR